MTSITRRWFISYHDFPISLYLNGLQFPLISYFGNERSYIGNARFLPLELPFPYKGNASFPSRKLALDLYDWINLTA